MRDGAATRILKTILFIIAILTVNTAVSATANQPDSNRPFPIGSNPHGEKRKLDLAQLDAQRQNPSEVKRYVQASVANLRQRPDAESEIVAKLPIKTEVTVLETASSWALVRVGEDMGWISSSLLIDRSPTAGMMYEGLVKASRARDWQLQKVYAERAAALAPNSIKTLEALIEVLKQAGDQAVLEKAKWGLAQAWERQYRLGSFIDPEEFLAQTPAKNAKPNRQVTVSNAKELVGALAPNTTILLHPGRYIFKSDAASGELSNLSPYYDGRIHDLEGLALVGLGPEPAIILESQTTSPALTFDRVRNLRLANLAIGHHPDLGACMGSVLDITDSKNIFISHASLFGSGTEGLTLENVDQLTLQDSAISNCSEGLSTINNSNAIHFKRVDIVNNIGIYKGFMLQSSDLTITDSRIYNNDVTEFGEAIPRSWTESPFYFNNLPDVCSDEVYVRSAEFKPLECRESYLRLVNTSVEGDVIDREWRQRVPDLIDPNCGYRQCSSYQPNCGVEDYDCFEREYNKVVKSVETAGGHVISWGLHHFPGVFIGKINNLENGSFDIVFYQSNNKKELSASLDNICQTSEQSRKLYFIHPQIEDMQFKCISSSGGVDKPFSIKVQYDQENSQSPVANHSVVIVSTNNKRPAKTWKTRALTESEIRDVNAIRKRHVEQEYKVEIRGVPALYEKYGDRAYTLAELCSVGVSCYMLETKLGKFMLFPVTNLIGEFVTPMILAVKEVQPGEWQEAVLFAEGVQMSDLDGDGFPEFVGGDQDETWVRKIYPNPKQ